MGPSPCRPAVAIYAWTADCVLSGKCHISSDQKWLDQCIASFAMTGPGAWIAEEGRSYNWPVAVYSLSFLGP